jgi:hypothetical protein
MEQFIPEDCDLENGVDLCVHGKPFSVICVQCCPEDDDGSFTGDEWSEG